MPYVLSNIVNGEGLCQSSIMQKWHLAIRRRRGDEIETSHSALYNITSIPSPELEESLQTTPSFVIDDTVPSSIDKDCGVPPLFLI